MGGEKKIKLHLIKLTLFLSPPASNCIRKSRISTFTFHFPKDQIRGMAPFSLFPLFTKREKGEKKDGPETRSHSHEKERETRDDSTPFVSDQKKCLGFPPARGGYIFYSSFFSRSLLFLPWHRDSKSGETNGCAPSDLGQTGGKRKRKGNESRIKGKRINGRCVFEGLFPLFFSFFVRLGV